MKTTAQQLKGKFDQDFDMKSLESVCKEKSVDKDLDEDGTYYDFEDGSQILVYGFSGVMVTGDFE